MSTSDFLGAGLLIGQAETYGLSWLFLPAFVAAVSFIFGSIVYKKYRDVIDQKLRESAPREIHWILLAVFEILLTGGLIEAADFSAILEDDLRLGSLISCTLLPISFAGFVVTQMWGSYHHFRTQDRFESDVISGWESKLTAAQVQLAAANLQYSFSDRVRKFLTVMVESDSSKRDEIQREFDEKLIENAVKKNGSRIAPISFNRFLRHANPIKMQTAMIVVVAQQVLEQHRPRIDHQRNRVRVALFERKGDYLRVMESFNGRRQNIVKTPQSDGEKFKLSNSNGCLAVEAAYLPEGKYSYAVNAAKSDGDTNCGFRHFNNEQKARIKSIIAFPIRFQDDHELSARYVICADCDRPDFFSEDMSQECSFLADYAKTRLRYGATLDEIYQCLALSFKKG